MALRRFLSGFALGLPGKDDVAHAYHRWLVTSIAALGLLTLTAAVVINGLLSGMPTHDMRHLMF